MCGRIETKIMFEGRYVETAAQQPSLLPLFALAFLSSNVGESAFQLSRKIGFECSDAQGLATCFTTESLVQFVRAGAHITPFAGDRHSVLSPALWDRHGLTQKFGDLLPALQYCGRRGRSRFPWRLASMFRASAQSHLATPP